MLCVPLLSTSPFVQTAVRKPVHSPTTTRSGFPVPGCTSLQLLFFCIFHPLIFAGVLRLLVHLYVFSTCTSSSPHLTTNSIPNYCANKPLMSQQPPNTSAAFSTDSMHIGCPPSSTASLCPDFRTGGAIDSIEWV